MGEWLGLKQLLVNLNYLFWNEGEGRQGEGEGEGEKDETYVCSL